MQSSLERAEEEPSSSPKGMFMVRFPYIFGALPLHLVRFPYSKVRFPYCRVGFPYCRVRFPYSVLFG